MLNKQLFEWLKDLPRNESFVLATALSDRPIEEAYDVELALRFLVLGLIEEASATSIGDVGFFLTEKMTEIAKNKKYKKKDAQLLFEATFGLINEVMGDAAFKRYNTIKGRHEGGFLLSQYEVVALGIAFNIASGSLCDKADIPSRIQSIWGEPEFTEWARSGVTAARRLPRLLPFGRKLFQK